ncbi:hypothetical protein NKH53_26195 [Mesorhizobium australicum]|uniref:hypothetical protein n=1 Tax=Mesorhizobium australicum TaxID=536018 RepID=UPI00333B271F
MAQPATNIEAEARYHDNVVPFHSRVLTKYESANLENVADALAGLSPEGDGQVETGFTSGPPAVSIDDADYYGEWNQDIQYREIAVRKAGKITDTKWRPFRPSVSAPTLETLCAAWFTGFLVRKEKDGEAFFPGELVGPNKSKDNVKNLHMLWLDVDDGTSFQTAVNNAFAAGLFFIAHPSHSYGTSKIEIKHKAYQQWSDKEKGGRASGYDSNKPSVGQIREYLQEKTHYREWVIESAKAVRIELIAGGPHVIVDTDPIEKFRVGLVLNSPWQRMDYLSRDKEMAAEWGDRLRAMGLRIGVKIDEATTNIDRAYYRPSRRSDAQPPRIVINRAGAALDWDSIVPAQKPADRKEAFADAGDGLSGGESIVTPGGCNLKYWASKTGMDRADYFDVVQAIKDGPHADEIVYEDKGDKLILKCPFEANHGRVNGPFDAGCFVAADGQGMRFQCSHNSCNSNGHNDRLVLICEAVKLGWIEESALLDPQYDTHPSRGDDETAPDAALLGFDVLLNRAVSERADDGVIGAATKDALIECCASGRAPSNAVELLKVRVKIGATEFGKKVADRKKELRKKLKKDRARDTIYASDDFNVQCEVLESALLQRNDRQPSLYNFGGATSRLIETVDDKGPRMILAPMNRDEFECECNDTLTFVFDLKEGEERKEAIPLVVVKKTWNMAIRDYLLPLRRIVTTPIHAANGSLCQTAGYARDVCALVDIGDLSIPPVNDCPTTEELERAKNLILIDLLGDWCFADDFGGEPREGVASKAHTVALLLQHFARELYSGCTPGFLIDKPAPGTGATYLVDVIHRVAHGRSAAAEAFPETEDEVRKGTTAKLRAGVSMIFYDNVRRKFGGSAVAALLTAETWRDRILGETRIAEYPNLGVMVVTANNASISDELVRRLLPIRLDARMPEAALEDRTFRKPDLSGWVMENRGELVWACLTLIQNWIAKGRHPARQGFKSYESFAKVMGGILDAAGIDGFMQNVDAFRASKKVENLEDIDLMQALFDGPAAQGAKAFSAAEAHDTVFETSGVCKFAGLTITADRDDEHLQNRVLGSRLEKRLNSYRLAAGDYRFEKAGMRDGSNTYRFAQIRAADASVSPAEGV